MAKSRTKKATCTERAAIPKDIYLVEELALTAIGKIDKPALKENAMKRALEEALLPFGLDLNISVEPDKTYGSVAIIEIDSSLSERQIENIKQFWMAMHFRRN